MSIELHYFKVFAIFRDWSGKGNKIGESKELSCGCNVKAVAPYGWQGTRTKFSLCPFHFEEKKKLERL